MWELRLDKTQLWVSESFSYLLEIKFRQLWNSFARSDPGARRWLFEAILKSTLPFLNLIFFALLTWLWGSLHCIPNSDPPAPAAPSGLVLACRQRWSACSAAGGKSMKFSSNKRKSNNKSPAISQYYRNNRSWCATKKEYNQEVLYLVSLVLLCRWCSASEPT